MPNRVATLLVGALLAAAGATALAACTGVLPPTTDPSQTNPEPAEVLIQPPTEYPEDWEDTAVPASADEEPSPSPEPVASPSPAASPSPVATASPKASGIYLRSHVVPILAQHCKSCHVTGGIAPFALFDAAGNPLAETVKARFDGMVTAIEAGRMPKGKPNSIPADQMAVLKAWRSAGMPLDPAPSASASPSTTPSPAAASPEPTAPTIKTVSFQDHVVPILRNRCSTCHSVGGRGASEVTMFNRAGQVQFWAIAKEIDDMIEEVEEGEMPKGAPPGTVKAWELDTLRAWYQAGTPNN